MIEFPTPEDEMVKRLLDATAARGGEYRLDLFERELRERFAVERSETIGEGTRVLFHARRLA